MSRAALMLGLLAALAGWAGHGGPIAWAQGDARPARQATTQAAAQGATQAATQGAVPVAPAPPDVAPDTPARVPLPPPRRPQLSEAQAAQFSRQAVLAQAGPEAAPRRDGWEPLADGVITGTQAPAFHYRVDPARADGQRVFATVQAAVRQAHAAALAGRHAGSTRLYIGIAPGFYEEAVVVPAGPLPITLWGEGDAPDAVRLQHNLYSQMPGSLYAQRVAAALDGPDTHPDIQAPHRACAQRERIGTDCAVVLRVRNHGFQLRKLTVANRYAQDQPGNLHQAVAVLTDGADRVHLEQVQLLGHQDTLFLRNPAPGDAARVFVHRSLVAGDVDFIFGDAVAYFLRTEVRWVGGLRGARSGYITAPSTLLDQAYGLVFEDCDFTSDGLGLAARRQVHLGRQWFYGARCSPYGAAGERCVPEPAAATRLPGSAGAPGERIQPSLALRSVGKVVVLRSRIGAHVDPNEPWAPWNRSPVSPAYRPAQYDSADFWRLLAAAGHDAGAWGWVPPANLQPWLAEYRNQPPPAAAGSGDNVR